MAIVTAAAAATATAKADAAAIAKADAAATRDGARRPFFRRKKTCPFSGANAPKIDYKDVKLLQRLHLRARQDRAVAASPRSRNKKQRILANAIKRARFMALLPYVVK